ncbi:MAG: MoaF N-terminal domain-containing protein [Candidatus Competibacterales bacterium]
MWSSICELKRFWVLSVALVMGGFGTVIVAQENGLLVELDGRKFDYRNGDYHIEIEFIGETQLKWTYLSAPGGLSGKTATESYNRHDITEDVVMISWTEADGTHVVDVFDFEQQKVFVKGILPNGQWLVVSGEMQNLQ